MEQGGEVTVPLTLKNTGIVNQTFTLNASHNSSMDISYSYRDFNITTLRVNTGESVDISALFDVPEMTEPGIYNIQLNAVGKNAVSESITVDIRESQSRGRQKEISIDADQSYIGIKPGEEKQVPVRVRNQGDVMLDNVEISVNAPKNWETSISRKKVPGLEQYESFRSIITVKAPVNADTGDSFLEVSASSDDTSTEQPARIRMTVQKESNLRYIGLGIMILSLGGLVFVYRKLGRR
ncbi:MAG: NEW3 domain-containing protein [Candidatus Nanohalobium sp.]